MSKISLPILSFFFSALSISFAIAPGHKWELKNEYKSPDCFKKLVVTINGETSGPTIYAEQNDEIVVDVKNSLVTENAAIHRHGMLQIGTPWSDGTVGVTQCPILTADTFRCKFVVDRPGTYLYRVRYGLQRENGVYGLILVGLPKGEVEPYAYDHDTSIVLDDWYHRSTYGEPQSLLIQGRGRFNCSTPTLAASVCNATNPQCSPFVISAIPGKTYRLRIGSLTALSALSFQIEGHNMTVIEADGRNVEPFVVQNLYIYPRQTYSVLVKADQNPSRNYWATSSVVSSNSTTPPALAIFNYIPNPPQRSPPRVPPSGPRWNDIDSRVAQSNAIKARHGCNCTPPQTSDRVIVMQHTPKNNVSANHPRTPHLFASEHKLGHARNKNSTVSDGNYRLKFNTTVDVILQNPNSMTPNAGETHPWHLHWWHLHGHGFWIVGYGEEKFDSHNDPKKYNLVDPIMKNTVPVHSDGWTALRIRANNPGTFIELSVVWE